MELYNISILTFAISGWTTCLYFFNKLKDQKHINNTLNDSHQNLAKLLQSMQQQYTLSQQNHLHNSMQDIRSQLQTYLEQHAKSINTPISILTKTIENQLIAIANQVDQKLDQGFIKTHNIFNDVIKSLTKIDTAQQKIQNLATHMIDLKNLLNDKKSRGTFGESQLNNLIKNMVPAQHFSLQHTLSNGKRPDCLLLLPAPTGNIAIDAKFPLESYQNLQNCSDPTEQNKLHKQFKQDLSLHINAIAGKYIIKNETANGAIMFIPAEAIFAHIHTYYPEIIDMAHNQKVWLTSPTTMMAILTTATSVLKDIETQNQVHEIQTHLGYLNQDFQRFKKRMEQLSKHIEQAHTDIRQVHTSADKISKRFNAIEQVDLNQQTNKIISAEQIDS